MTDLVPLLGSGQRPRPCAAGRIRDREVRAMTWIIAPSADRALARRVAQRIDQILGFPRTLAEQFVADRAGITL